MSGFSCTASGKGPGSHQAVTLVFLPLASFSGALGSHLGARLPAGFPSAWKTAFGAALPVSKFVFVFLKYFYFTISLENNFLSIEF